LVVALAIATVGGLIWRARNGRVRPEEERVDLWAELGVDPGGAAVTLVQFSSAFCAPCRATRRILTDVSEQLTDVQHVEIDAESHLDVVRALDVRSTPTTLLVDRSGNITGRAVGQPRRNDVLAAIGPYLSPGA
jgi:thiol-disulfide isomerase/thioredoxin